MNNDTVAQITSVIVGVLATIAWRLIDRYLPDPRGRYPLPPRPGAPPYVPPYIQQQEPEQPPHDEPPHDEA